MRRQFYWTFWIIFLCVFTYAQLSAQSTTRMFRRLHIYHPDCPNNVTALLQDQRGFIWVGSKSGLYRFDGYEFKSFRNNRYSTDASKNNHIRYLFEDKTGIIWISENNNLKLFDPKTLRFQQPPFGSEILDIVKKSTVTQMLHDSKDDIWIITNKNETIRYHPNTGKTDVFDSYDGADYSSTRIYVNGIAEDKHGNIFLSKGLHIYQFNRATQSFDELSFKDAEGNVLNISPMKLIATDTDELWVSTFNRGIYQVNLKTGDWKGFQHDPNNILSLSENRILDIFQDNRKNIWVATVKGGLNYFDTKKETFVRYQNTLGEINSLSANHVFSIQEDQNGLIWVGTIKGIDILKLRNNQFEYLQKNINAQSSLTSNKISALLEDRNGYLWIGTRDAGLNRYDATSRTYKAFQQSNSNLGNNTIWSILEDQKGRIWITTSNGFLHLFDPNTEDFRRFPLPNIEYSTFGQQVRCISEDETGILWLGTLGSGLYAFDTKTESFQTYRLPKSRKPRLPNSIFTLQTDQKGGLWMGTLGGGVNFFDLKEKTVKKYPKKMDQSSNYWSNKYIYSLFVDRQERVWVGTGNAKLALYDPEKDDFKYFFEDEENKPFTIAGITDDAKGNLWLATDNGLLHFTPPENPYQERAEGTIKRFTREDGLQDNDFFKTTAVHQNPSGHIYVGGHLGFNRFHPDSLNFQRKPPEIILTDFQIFNESIPIASNQDSMEEHFHLEKHVEYLDEIVLNHHQRIFSVYFTTNDYLDANNNRFAYRLKGFNNDWVEIANQNSVTFTNLDAGKYTLEIKAAKLDGIWGEKTRTLHLKITPPWWQTTWAYILWIGLVLSSIYLLYQYLLRQRLKEAEANRLLEMDRLKTNLYNNITHEFRTPLTIIMGINDTIKGNTEEKNIIKKNSGDLLQLVNQMLDLSKLKAGQLTLNYIQADIISFLAYLTDSFLSIAREKEVHLTFYSENESLIMDFDEQKIQHILYNLLSNAIKFTPYSGRVVVHVKAAAENQLQIIVKDNGKGISEEHLPHIFNRFYQADTGLNRQHEGTGIGLALTKDLVELMEGEISVKSQLEKGTEFMIQLPIHRKAPEKAIQVQEENIAKQFVPVMTTASNGASKEAPIDPDKASLLVVEDNRDITSYLKLILKDTYNIQNAVDGNLGFQLATEQLPDIIISDVMLPHKNGYELCAELKQDRRTSHIPIILLTGLSTEKDRIAGLNSGADAFLTKPFNKDELMIRLENLVTLRKELQERFAIQVSDILKAPNTSTPNLEDTFIEQLKNVIEEKMNRSDFQIADLAEGMNMSQVQVYRKLKALTGCTPSQFVRSIRLQKGKALVLESELTIAEIAYEVGFADPSYFTRTFQKEFGKAPREFRH